MHKIKWRNGKNEGIKGKKCELVYKLSTIENVDLMGVNSYAQSYPHYPQFRMMHSNV